MPFRIKVQWEGGGESIDCVNIRVVLKLKEISFLFAAVFNYDTKMERNLGKELLNPDWSRLFAPPAKQIS